MVWSDGAGHTQRGSIIGHHRRNKLCWIVIDWDGGRGRGMFLDNSWPPELTTHHAAVVAAPPAWLSA
jgi:hypothetical protein